MGISIVVVNYNHEKYLETCLLSFLNQSPPPDEVLVVDDASTDGSVELLLSLQKKYFQLQILRNEKNQGAVISYNIGIQAAKNEILCTYAADDRVFPGFLKTGAALLEQYPEAGFFCSHPSLRDGTTGILDMRESYYKVPGAPRYVSPEETSRIVPTLWIATHTCLFRKSAMVECGLLLPKLQWHADWFLTHLIAFRYGFCYSAEVFSTLSVFPNSYSHAAYTNLPARAEVYWEMVELLRSPEYEDVKDFFGKSALFEFFPDFNANSGRSLPVANLA